MNERTIFIAALDIEDTTARESFLDEACRGNRSLRERVNALIHSHEQAISFLDGPPPGIEATEVGPITEAPGIEIGPYRLLEQIGEGGFGVVFMAEQTAPVKRKVALKVIKPGMDTREVIARFEAERQALALMDHPNIAKVFDAGATETGRPFFVMELVRGVPITEYCDQAHLTPRERLNLFVTVCQAVQHAHQKGIIHRDIKPTNVLVARHDDRPVVKVIDFGVAKATIGQLTDKTLLTGFAQVVGTPLYMSPEQAALSAIDVDTRSDIYSLGVLLYELLTGTTPFDKARLHQAAFDEVRRIIREEEPQKPSTRLSSLGATLPSVSAVRKTEPRKLSQLVHGDLDWIVMKALEKDRARRYETANGLARDIERFLNHEPVEATPPSAGYRFRKFARRNKAVLATAALVSVAIILGLIGTTWQAIRATRAEHVAQTNLDDAEAERDRADQERQRAEANFQRARQAVDDMYTQVAEKWLAEQPQMTPLQREFLLKALNFYSDFAERASTDPGVRFETAQAYRRVADIQHKLGHPVEGEAAIRQAVERMQSLVDESPDVPEFRARLADTLHQFGVLLGDTGRRADEEQAHRRALELQETLVADFPDVPDYQCDLGRGYLAWGKSLNQNSTARAVRQEVFQKSIALLEKLAADFPATPDHRRYLGQSLQALATLQTGGEPGKARETFRKAIELYEQLAADFPTTTVYRILLGDIYCWQARALPFDEAERSLRKAVDIQRKLVADFPSVTNYRYNLLRSLHDLGGRLHDAGQSQRAEEAYREAIAIGEKLAADSPDVHYHHDRLLSVLSDLVQVLYDTDRLPEAEAAKRQLYEKYDKLAAQSPNVLGGPTKLGHSLRISAFRHWDRGRKERAEATLRQALEVWERLTADFPDVLAHWHYRADTLRRLGGYLLAMNRKQEAEAAFRESLDLFEQRTIRFPGKTFNEDERAAAYFEFASLLFTDGRHDEALALWEKLVADSPKNFDDQLALANCHNDCANLLKSAGRVAEAEQFYREALDLKNKLVAEAPAIREYRFHLAHTYLGLAYLFKDTTRPEEAESDFRQALALFEKLAADFLPADNYRLEVGHTLWHLGDVLFTLQRNQEAEQNYRRGLETFSTLAAEFPDRPYFALEHGFSHWKLAWFMRDTGRPQEMEEHLRHVLAVYGKAETDFPDDPEFRNRSAQANRELAAWLQGAGRHDEAEQLYRQALALVEKLAVDFPAGHNYRQKVGQTLRQLIEDFLPQGKHAEVAKLAVEFARGSSDKSDLLRVAVYLDQCAALAERDPPLTPVERKAASDAYAQQAAELMTEAGELPAGDGQLENELAWRLVTNSRPELQITARAVELARKGVELAPEAGDIWNTLGVAQYRAGDWKAAIATLEKSMDLRGGGDSLDWLFIAMARWQLGEKELAQKWYQAAALWMARQAPNNEELKRFRAEAATLMGLPETEPSDATDDLALGEILVELQPHPSSYSFRGAALAKSDQWARAADDYTKAIELGGKSFLSWYSLALLRRAQDDAPAYQAVCADMLKQFATTDDAQTASFVAWTSALGPEAITDFAPAVALAEQATSIDPKSSQFANSRGAILYRAGRFAEALQTLEDSERLAGATDQGGSSPVYTWYLLAMIQHRLGHADDAAIWHDKARQETDKALTDDAGGTATLAWNRRLTLKLLRDEAEELLATEPVPPTETK